MMKQCKEQSAKRKVGNAMLKKEYKGSFLNHSDLFKPFSTVFKTLYLPLLSLYMLIFLLSCTDHSNVVEPSSDSTIADWFNVTVTSSIAVSSSSETSEAASSDAGTSSGIEATSSVAGSTSSTTVIPSSVASTSSTTVIPSSVAGTSSTTVIPSSVASTSSTTVIPSSIASTSSTTVIPSSVAVSSSTIVVPSSIAGTSSTIISSSSSYEGNQQQCTHNVYTSSTGALVCTEKSYATILIGTQTWMAENLNYTPTSGNSWCYGNVLSNCSTYGRLYDWSTAEKACPIGWHVPTDAEWQTLEMELGMTSVDAAKLGSRGTDQGTQLKANDALWNTNTGTNSSGFSGLPGGNYYNGSFDVIGQNGYWWVAPVAGTSDVRFRSLVHNSEQVNREYASATLSGLSIRCLKDAN